MSVKTQTANIDKFSKLLFPIESKKSPLSLKDHIHIPFILDTLSRKQHHHILLTGSQSEIFNQAFLENIATHLADEHLPKTLSDVYFTYLDIENLLLSTPSADKLEKEFKSYCDALSSQHKHIIIAINSLTPLLADDNNSLAGKLGETLKSLLLHEQWRMIIITTSSTQKTLLQQSYLKNLFSTLKLSEPITADSLAILKTFRHELENFHHIIIPDETFAFALSMSSHYLSGQVSNLDKALQLLDSGAARASALDRNDQSGHKPILTNAILAHIVSSWTQIPLSHLQQNKFNAADFIQTLQKQIFGQEAAINLIGLVLQYARMKLQNKSGPLCSFLFAGPANVGKTETAFALAEHLFGHKDALLRISIDKTLHPKSLADIRVMTQSDEHTSTSLFEAIQQRPYAVVLLENINQAAAGTIDLFQDIFTYGFASDHQGNKYDFRHAIVIITTTLGSERIISLTQTHTTQDSMHTADLMQLVLSNDQLHDTSPSQPNLSPQELSEEMRPALETYFSSKLLSHFNLIPFALLDYPGIEKIIRLKLKALAKQLDANYSIELTYAPEVIRFLVQETLWRGEATRPIDKILDQNLYSCVAHELISYAEDKNRPKRLLLQLNDAGQVLRCEFISPGEATLYKL